MERHREASRGWKSALGPVGARRQRPEPRYRHWCLQQPWSLGFFLNGLGALFLAVFIKQTINVVLGDAQGFGLWLGHGLNLLPVLLGGQAFEAFADYAAEATVSGFS